MQGNHLPSIYQLNYQTQLIKDTEQKTIYKNGH